MSNAATASDSRDRMIATVSALKSTIASGKLSSHLSLGGHVRTAKALIARHAAEFASTKADLEALAPVSATVKGRVKDLESALGKLVRKPAYHSAANLQDTTGLRVVCETLAGVAATVEGIKSAFCVITEDDYIAAPKASYRSHHLIIATASGLQVEVQVRTARQNLHAVWCHDVYKPMTAAQASALVTNAAEIEAYSAAVSEHFAALDAGAVSTMPEAPAAVVAHFGACPQA